MKFARTTSRTKTIEFEGHWLKVEVTWFFVFFCVRDAAATRRRYLALSKAWRSCFNCCYH